MLDLIPAPTLLAYVGLVVAIAIAPGSNVLFVMTNPHGVDRAPDFTPRQATRRLTRFTCFCQPSVWPA